MNAAQSIPSRCLFGVNLDGPATAGSVFNVPANLSLDEFRAELMKAGVDSSEPLYRTLMDGFVVGQGALRA